MKLPLLNTETGMVESFEPVDAREILQGKGSIYRALPEVKKQIGLSLEASPTADINIPQMHGLDNELQTGLQENKYARQAVVKAIAGDPGNGGKPIFDTEGKPIEGSQNIDSDELARRTAEQLGGTVEGEDGSMTVAELKAELDRRGVEYTSADRKADLQEKLSQAQKSDQG